MSFDISKLTHKLDLSGGEWIDDIDDNPGVRLKVRSTRYKPYRNAIERLARKAGKNGIATQDLGAALSEHLLVDWDFSEGDGPLVLTDGGKPVSYSSDLANAVLTADDDYGIGQQFRDAVWNAGNKLAEKLAAETKAAAGN